MYYNVKVQLQIDNDGKIKKVSENYLVQAESVTDAEAIMNEKMAGSTIEFEVKSVTASKIVDVYSN